MTSYLNALGVNLYTSATKVNSFWGAALGQTLTGTSGADGLRGNGIGDVLVGGAGDDTYYIYSTLDQVVEQPNGGTDTVVSGAPSYILPANVENLTMTSTEWYGSGNGLDNIITSQAPYQQMEGGGGNDVFIGSTYTTFIIDAGKGSDRIYNWSSTDTIRLNGYGITSFAQVQSIATQVGSDVVLRFANGDILDLTGVTLGQLTAANFELGLSTSGMKLAFDGEFNSLSLYNAATGTGIWRDEYGYGGAGTISSRTLPGEAEIYMDPSFAGTGTSALGINPFSVNNGILSITAAPVTAAAAPYLAGHTYTSGLLTTKYSFSMEYGYFQATVKMPSGAGFWPAFWLLPSNGSWPPELDVFEMLGKDPTTVYMTSHYTTATSSNAQTQSLAYVDTTQWHTYGVDWEATTLTFYIDGVAVAQMATPSDMNTPMYMLLNLAVGGTNSWGGGANASTGTGVMQVSSVKAYATAGTVQETVNGVTTYFTNGNATSTATTLTSGTNGAPPVANADSFATKECAALTVSAANGVLANDTSSTNLALSAVLDTTTLHGKLVLNADGSFSYTPTAGYVGADSFTYQAEDSKGNFSSATTVSLNVTQVTPTANADSFAGKEGTALSVSAANGVLANDTGASGLALSAVLGTTTQHGALALNADGSFTYTPNAGYSGTDSFTYQAKDSTGALSSAATVTLNVAQVLPSATSYTGYTTAYEAPLTIAATTLLAGASDAAGYPLSVTGVSNAVGGTVSFSNGLITFTPASWYSGAASFSYTVADAYGDTATASVNLSVGAEVKPSSLYIYGGTANQTIDKHLSSFGWMINAGSGNDIILGGAGSNSLNAGTGNTTLIGGASADLLQAGTGVDVLTGGGGADTFLFAAGTLHKLGSAGGIDSITDFISGGVASVHDVIKFSGFGAGASLSYTSTNTDGSFNYHVTAGSYSGDLIIQSGGHKLVAADYLFM